MKNIVKILILSILFTSCFQQNENVSEQRNVSESVSYFKDRKTNLCFAQISSLSSPQLNFVTSISCVHCDSLKNIQVK